MHELDLSVMLLLKVIFLSFVIFFFFILLCSNIHIAKYNCNKFKVTLSL